tara:strand:- start:17729 stop:19237 length:1509 start_codon:yes stop_codon:yes gene_type:complete
MLGNEGVRVGGVTATTASFIARADDTETVLIELFEDRRMLAPLASGSAVASSSDHGYVFVNFADLPEDRQIYWKATGSGGGEFSGAFTTPASEAGRNYKLGMISCMQGFQFGYGSLSNARWAGAAAAALERERFDSVTWLGDVYYSDVGTEQEIDPLDDLAWFVLDEAVGQPVENFLSNYKTTMDALKLRGQEFGYGDVAALPGLYMFDDHDHSYNDVDDIAEGEGGVSPGEATSINNGYQASRLGFLRLNENFLQQEGMSVPESPWGTRNYFYVDYPPLRMIVLDGRTFRDQKTKLDGPDKTMLGTAQLEWLFDQIDNCPHEYICIATPLMLDGDHGWRTTSGSDGTDCFKNYSYERDAIFRHIWNAGRAHKTFFIEGDTHNGQVTKFEDWLNPGNPPIWGFASACNWFSSFHFINTGFGGDIKRSFETVAASGHGGIPVYSQELQSNCVVLDVSPTGVRVSLATTYPHVGFKGAAGGLKRVYSRDFGTFRDMELLSELSP